VGAYADLHAGLCGGKQTPWLKHARVHLLLDRGAGPAGARRFKDLRCLGRGAEFAWPSPGVYTIPELARKIILHAQRTRTLDVPKPASELLNLVRLKTLAPEASPIDLLAQLRHFRKLRPLGATNSQWRDVLERIEEGDSPELGEWTRRALLWIQLRGSVYTDGRAESQWDFIELAVALLEDPLFQVPWEVLTERKPGHTEKVDFAVACFKEAYPLEDRFLRALDAHRKVHRLLPEEADFNPAESRVMSASEFAALDARDGIFWAYSDATPSVAETCEWLPGTQALDVPFDERAGTPPLLRALYLWADFEAQARAPNHAWLRSKEPAALLATRGFKTDVAPNPDEIMAFIQEEAGERAQGLDEVAEVSAGDLPAWILALGDLGLLRDERRGAPHVRVSADGVPLLTLEDLPLAGARTQVLWSTPKALQPLLEAHSEDTLAKRPLPTRLNAALEAVGLAVPDPAREAPLMLRALASSRSALCWLEAQGPRRGVERAAPTWRGAPLKGAPYSPSRLQSHLDCPLRHYLDRERSLKKAPAWDPENFDARAKGDWIHNALEQFLRAPDWQQPHARLQTLLEEGIEAAFTAPHSPSYRRLLAAQSRVLSAQLARHIEDFERPLAELCPTRELKLEEDHAASFLGTSFKGRVDRVDLLPNNEALLWDYKSGRTDGKAETQVKAGKIQWFLYRRILREQGFNVVGGGYLNPLDPAKSKLFALNEGFGERLSTLFDGLRHDWEPLSVDALERIDVVVEEKITLARAGIESGNITPRPREEKICMQCEHRGLCGRPYLELS
jgi:RecB family exonuclease